MFYSAPKKRTGTPPTMLYTLFNRRNIPPFAALQPIDSVMSKTRKTIVFFIFI